MSASSIEWTDMTWNPVTGCTRVSPGCANCYIERTPPFRMGGRRFAVVGQESTTGVRLHPDRLGQPLRWRKPRRVFVCSLADLFHDDVPDEYIAEVFDAMRLATAHTFQVLTKRPERAAELLPELYSYAGSYEINDYDHDGQPLPNVWLGVSIESARYTWRADVLREIPAAVRFISAEPLLASLFAGGRTITVEDNQSLLDRYGPDAVIHRLRNEGGKKPLDLTGIDWVIVGGESGPGARTFYLEHAREIIRAVHAKPTSESFFSSNGAFNDRARPALFVKQLGARPLDSTADLSVGHLLALRDRKGGDPAEWPADLRIREFPAVAA